MKKKNLLIQRIVLTMLLLLGYHSTFASVQIEAKMMPALYKTKAGLTQGLYLTINYQGNAPNAIIQLGKQKKRQKLINGKNTVLFEIPQILEPKTEIVSVMNGKDVTRKEITLTPIRKWEMNFVQHTHTDIGYTRSQTEILAEHLRYIDYALDFCDATDNYPEFAKFRWTCEISWAVSEYLKCRPESQIARLKKRVKEGRIEVASMYLNFDELPDEQTLAASLYPLKEFRDRGIKSELAMQNDVNGIGWCFSEYFADAGIKYVNMGTHGHRALICFEKPTVFWWQSPSGKKVLTYRAEHYNQGNFFGIDKGDFCAFEAKVLTYLEEMEAKHYPYDVVAIQHSGYFTDNSPPSTRSCEMIKEWNDKYEYPKLRTSVASDFFKEVETKYADKIETIRGAWPDWWTDGFASGAREAAVSRITHSNIIANQGGLSMAKMMGTQLPTTINQQVDEVNKALLFYDEHTFGYCESVRDPYGKETWEQRSLKQSYAWEGYRRTGQVGEVTMGLLQSFVPQSSVPSIALFNPLNWNYSGVAKVYIDHQILPLNKQFEIVDYQGNPVPAQAGESRSDGTYWSLYVKDVPALGYAQLYIKVANKAVVKKASIEKLSVEKIENDWYQIEINPDKGTISKLYDKELQKELLTPNATWQMGEFVYEIIDSRHPMEQRKAAQSIRRRPENMRLEKIEQGAIWNTYTFVCETPAGRESKNLSIEFRIFNVTKKIELVYTLRKKAITDPESIYISFPFEVEKGKIFLDVPGGNIEAGKDQIIGSSNDWYTVQNFATARNDDFQVVMGSKEIPLMQFGAINTGRYQAGALPQSTNMYSWPMNNYWVTNFNADQMGQMQWSYFLSSSKDNSLEFATKFAWENRIPLLTRVLPARGNSTTSTKPCKVFNIEPNNLLLVNMKPIEGENAIILQLREIAGKKATFKVSSDKLSFSKVTVCDVVGQTLSEVREPEFNAWESKFIKLTW